MIIRENDVICGKRHGRGDSPIKFNFLLSCQVLRSLARNTVMVIYGQVCVTVA